MDREVTIKQSRNLQIEGLRGCALLMIVVYHLVDRFQQIYLNTSIRWMDMWGTFGTTCFFLISSFFLVNVENKHRSIQEIVHFFIKKVLRLWPCYFVCITLTYIVTHIWFLPGRTVEIKDYILNLLWVNRFVGSPYIDGAHWYLGVLISVTILLLLFDYFRIQRCQIVYLIWMVVEILFEKLTSLRETYILGGPFIGIICTGIALRFILSLACNWDTSRLTELLKWSGVIFASLLCTFLLRGGICALEQCFASFIIAVCALEKCPCLKNRILIFLGTVSYPVYLIHQNIGYVIEYQIMKFTGSWNYAIAGLAVLFTIVCGIGLYYLIENPIKRVIIVKVNKSKR